MNDRMERWRMREQHKQNLLYVAKLNEARSAEKRLERKLDWAVGIFALAGGAWTLWYFFY